MRLPDDPGMMALLDIELVGHFELFEFLNKLLSVVIVGLVLGRSPEVEVELVSWLVLGEQCDRAILLDVGAIVAPDGTLGPIIAAERDDDAKNIGMMHADIGRAEAAH